jgi:hypothetical protein
MKLYAYSNKLLTLVEMKWARTKLIAGGFIICALILFGAIMLNWSLGNAIVFRSANALTIENNILRQQLNDVAPKLGLLEKQVKQLDEHANELHMLLPYRKSIFDTVVQIEPVAVSYRSRSLTSGENNIHP